VEVISGFHKFLFAMLVSAYTITVVGIPVYFHYCGGELEKIDYLVKGSGCCDDDEQQGEENGCCKDEGKYLLNNPDFTIKDSDQLKSVKMFTQMFSFKLPFKISLVTPAFTFAFTERKKAPPSVLGVISVTVLRI
jgi:hypothetical protein